MVESNLQRFTILPSDKAFLYKMRLEAMKQQTGRARKENGVPLGPNSIKRGISRGIGNYITGQRHTNPAIHSSHESDPSSAGSGGRGKDRHTPSYGAVVFNFGGTMRSPRNHAVRRLYSIPGTGNEAAEILQRRMSERRCDPIYHERGKTQSAGKTQLLRRPVASIHSEGL